METLKDLLDLDLDNCSILNITEEHLILFKTQDFQTQNKFYFYLYKKLISTDKKDKKALAYGNYLLSYYLFIVMTPLYYEDLAFYHGKKAFEIENSTKYMEWLLLFGTLEKPLLTYELCSEIANKILKNNPNSALAKLFFS